MYSQVVPVHSHHEMLFAPFTEGVLLSIFNPLMYHCLNRQLDILAMFSQTRHGSSPSLDTFSSEGGCFYWDGPESSLLCKLDVCQSPVHA